MKQPSLLPDTDERDGAALTLTLLRRMCSEQSAARTTAGTEGFVKAHGALLKCLTGVQCSILPRPADYSARN